MNHEELNAALAWLEEVPEGAWQSRCRLFCERFDIARLGGTARALAVWFAEYAAIRALKREGVVAGAEQDKPSAVCTSISPQEALEDALHSIKQWAEAYPVEMFRPVSDAKLKEANAALKAIGVDMGALHAGWARHLLGGIANIARTALSRGVSNLPTTQEELEAIKRHAWGEGYEARGRRTL